MFKNKKGFTLIELLIVIGIIAILAAIIFVAVDPGRRLGEARDADRWGAVNSILNAVLKYSVDNAGNLPGSGGDALVDNATDVQILGTTDDSGVGFCAGGSAPTCAGQTVDSTDDACFVDLTSALVDTYLAAIPVDPDTTAGYGDANTGYYIRKSANNRIEVGSCNPEQVAAISVQR